MPLLKTKVNPFEQRDSQSSASKFIWLLHKICFIAVSEINGRLIFKFLSFKTLFHLLFVVICLCGFPIVSLVAFQHETLWISNFKTVTEFLSVGLLTTFISIPIIQPLILRYNNCIIYIRLLLISYIFCFI